MTFLYPLGLLGLIGIPIIVIIYIIKNKYTEQIIPSTYLWTLSEKFLKRRNPINKLAGIISLILQLLIVTCVSLAIAHPVFYLEGAASRYCFILDASGSMNMTLESGKTRFETGKGEIGSMIERSGDGSEYTLVVAGDTINVVYESINDKERALELLSDVNSVFVSEDEAAVLSTAQRYFNDQPSIETYLVTDKQYELTQNVKIVNVAGEEVNYSIGDVSYTMRQGADNNSTVLVVTGKVYSHTKSGDLNVSLFINDEAEAVATANVLVAELKNSTFELTCPWKDFIALRVVLDKEDSLAIDNEVVIYNSNTESAKKILIVSDQEFFIMSAFTAGGYSDVTAVATGAYEKKIASYKSGYDLYVFDSYTPAELPSDGAVWFFNPTASLEKTGFSVQDSTEIADVGRAKYAKSTASAFRKLTSGVDIDNSEILVKHYAQCSLYRSFTTLLTYNNYPMLFAGSNTFGNREVVFAFDIHVPFAFSKDYLALTQNLLSYTFPTTIAKTDYVCGESMEVNVVAGCKSIRIDSPLGKTTYLDTSVASAEYELTESGVYTITVMVGDNARVYNVFAAIPEAERETLVKIPAFLIKGEASGERLTGIFDKLFILFIAVAIFYLFDWMVYCYEQYQLR